MGEPRRVDRPTGMRQAHSARVGAREAANRERTDNSFGAAGMTVAELLAAVGDAGLRLVSHGGGILLPTGYSTLFDRYAMPEGQRSGVLLGIGVHPASADAVQLIRDSAERGFGALVVKSFSVQLDILAAVADAEGIALIEADDAVEWRQVAVMIDSALTVREETLFPGVDVGDLYSLANAIAAMVGGATAIEDLDERVLAYSTLAGQKIDTERRDGILGRQVPVYPGNVAQYAEVFRSNGAVHLPAVGDDGLPRLAIAVRAGSQPLGSIWVVDAKDDLGGDSEHGLERAASIAALHMLRLRSAADVVRQRRTELMRRLLRDENDAHLLAEEMGVYPQSAFVVVAFQADLAQNVDQLQMSQLRDLIVLQSDAYWPGALCTEIGATIYAMFPLGDRPSADAVAPVVAQLIARVKTVLHMAVTGAVGSTAASVAGVGKSRRDADLVLLLLSRRSRSVAVASADDVRSALILLELEQLLRATPGLLSPYVTRALELDAKTHTEYAKTLLTYLECGKDTAVAADRLSLHQNTLRYRLRRASELLGFDLNDPADTLALWLGLRAVEVG